MDNKEEKKELIRFQQQCDLENIYKDNNFQGLIIQQMEVSKQILYISLILIGGTITFFDNFFICYKYLGIICSLITISLIFFGYYISSNDILKGLESAGDKKKGCNFLGTCIIWLIRLFFILSIIFYSVTYFYSEEDKERKNYIYENNIKINEMRIA